MIFSLILVHILTLIPLVAAGKAWIKKVQHGGEYMVVTRANNYAIKSPNLSQVDWAIIYANGVDIVAISSNCREESFTLGSKNLWLINDIRDRLDEHAAKEVCNIHLNKGKLKNYEVISYEEDGSVENILSLNMNHDEDEIAIVGEGSIFFQQGTLTVVYLDGKIEMKPAVCLSPEDHEFLERLREAQESLRRVKKRSERLLESIFDEFFAALFRKRRVS